jgi:uncharacterized protein YbaR (Trm112 family)
MWIAILGGLVFAWGVIQLLRTEDRQFGLFALVGLGTCVVARLWAFILARSLVCPLCHGTVVHEKRCQKHAAAQRLPLLSYSATVATSVIFRGSFCCMYCGTAYRLKK